MICLPGVHMTCDDLHVWLAPFSAARPVLIRVDMGVHVELGMLRIWNYNKSRIHASRGARDIHVLLNSVTIFAGEVNQAPGNLADAPNCAECILFTEDESLLCAIDDFDERWAL